MAMGAIYLTDTSSGAPALSGTVGTLCAVLDWALVQKGWAVEYTATNNRVYRPGAGNRNRLYVGHDSAVSGNVQLATIRGAENASAAAVASLINPFPNLTQQPNNTSTVLCSLAASTVARPYRILLTDRFVLMFINTNSVNNINWDFFMFGDMAGTEAGDNWATIIQVGNSTTATSTSGRGMQSSVSMGLYANSRTYFARSIDGGVISSNATLWGSSSSGGPSGPCQTTGTYAMRGGYANRIDRRKVGVSCMASNSTTVTATGGTAVLCRGWVPHLWCPEHSSIGGVTADDVHTDTSYAAGSQFVINPAGSNVCFILETTDTWSPPNG